MRCPQCNEERQSVIDSRADDDAIRRRRECQRCGYRFTTFERIERVLPLIIKKDGRRESFVRDKIRKGLERAFEKRPVPADTIERGIETIELQINELSKKEVSTQEVGTIVLEVLKGIDQIAYVRFASVYREFSTVDQFLEALKGLDSKTVESSVIEQKPEEQ